MKPIIDLNAGLYRTIARAHVPEGVVLAEAFIPRSEEGHMLSVDQASKSTPVESFSRRLTPPALVQAISVADVVVAARSIGESMGVFDDHDPTDDHRAAHASIDFSAVTTRARRRAAAAVLADRSTTAYP